MHVMKNYILVFEHIFDYITFVMYILLVKLLVARIFIRGVSHKVLTALGHEGLGATRNG